MKVRVAFKEKRATKKAIGVIGAAIVFCCSLLQKRKAAMSAYSAVRANV